MTPDDDSRELYAVLASICATHRDKPSLNPAWLATEAMHVIAFPRELHNIGYKGCHLEFRQIARSFCRKRFDPAEAEAPDLFPETLQARYPQRPTDPDADPVYVLLDLMDDSDIQYNIDRLRKEARAKLRHADALEAWARQRFGLSA
jgi:hypothetical protein